jgi:hypothetical protein
MSYDAGNFDTINTKSFIMEIKTLMLSYYLRVSLKVLMLMGSKFTVNE